VKSDSSTVSKFAAKAPSIAPAKAGLAVLLGSIPIAVLAGHLGAGGSRGDGGIAGTIGPDVIVGALSDVSKYGTVSGVSAYAIGTTSCNIGDAELAWIDSGVNDNQHPVIAQNLFRLKNGRFEQIGQSWLKHGWCAVDGNLCGTCQSDGSCDWLGIGCSDPYSASLNGIQGDLGPRSQVNAATGAFPFPYTAPAAPATIGRRLQVMIDDLTPAMNPNSLYFGEGLYIHPEDATAGNDNNNASYRRILVGSLSSGSYTLSLTGSTFQQKSAIFAWKEHGLGVGIPDPGVTIVAVDVEGDGRFFVASKVSDNGDGTWHYEYAIQNVTSDRCARGFTVPAPDGSNPSTIGFHDTFSHSGEPFSTADWSTSVAGESVSWTTSTYAQNQNANALRFGTMYNFRFDAATPPTSGTAEIALFKPVTAGSPATVATVTVPVPSAPPSVFGDLNDDGVVDAADLAIVLGAWGTDGGTSGADLNGDGIVDGADLSLLLGAWDA
jgi:Dockerin type I domain